MRPRKPELIELDAVELRAIVELTRTSALDVKDYENLNATVETFLWMRAELEKSNATLARLRKDLSINTTSRNLHNRLKTSDLSDNAVNFHG